tara:strand:+ start:6578 stop:7171 length:594 start_codon:yes stop_codon:yes gene_type:complete
MNEIILFFNNINFNWSIIETAAVIFSIIYVILIAKENMWCWAAGAISVTLYIYICYNANLLAETGLQIFYLIMVIFGYYNWKKNDSELIICSWNSYKHIFIIILGTLLTFLMGYYFTNYTSASIPILDSFTTTFSIIATYMVIKKVLENWIYWIVIDIVSVYIYFSRELHLTSFLFIMYTIIAIIGYFRWLHKKNHV